MEFTGGEFLHLALVPNPRYERANIVMNSQDDTETIFLNGLKTIIENALDRELTVEDKTVLNGLSEIFNGKDFNEADVNRDELGRFAKKDGNKDVKHTLTDLLGEEFKDVKGQDAINKIYKERKGHVKDAFYRDDIGFITVCWGDDTCGLKHLEKEREDRNQDPIITIRALGKIIENGHIFKEEDDRWKIRYKKGTVIISKELKGDKATAIITGYISN